MSKEPHFCSPLPRGLCCCPTTTYGQTKDSRKARGTTTQWLARAVVVAPAGTKAPPYRYAPIDVHSGCCCWCCICTFKWGGRSKIRETYILMNHSMRRIITHKLSYWGGQYNVSKSGHHHLSSLRIIYLLCVVGVVLIGGYMYISLLQFRSRLIRVLAVLLLLRSCASNQRSARYKTKSNKMKPIKEEHSGIHFPVTETSEGSHNRCDLW